MSDRLLRVVLVLALGMPGPLSSQTRGELERRLAHLREANAQLDSAVARQRAKQLAVQGWRIISAGKLRLGVERRDAARATEVARLAWDRLLQRFGSILGTSDTIVMRIQRDEKDPRGDPLPLERQPLAIERVGRNRPGMPVTSPRLTPPVALDDLVDAVTLVASEQVWARADSMLAMWHAAPPAVTTTERNRQRAYIQLASSPFDGGRLCFAGDLLSCERMLGLVDRPLDPVASFPPQERREFVRRMWPGYMAEEFKGQAAACVERQDQTACDALLSDPRMPPRPLVPLDQDARGLLLTEALLQGGNGAIERLLADPGQPLAARLGAAAGVSPDSLVARWRQAVLLANPEPVGVTRAGAWAALSWGLVLFGLSLTSSRWR